MANPQGRNSKTYENFKKFLESYTDISSINANMLVMRINGMSKGNARTCLMKAKDDGYVIQHKDAKGHKVRGEYDVIKKLDMTLKDIQLAISDAIQEEQVVETEALAIQPEKPRWKPDKKQRGFSWRDFKLHHVVMSLTEQRIIEKNKQRCILTHTIPPDQKKDIEVRQLFTPMSQYNMQMIWRADTTSKLIRNEQNKSESEELTFGDKRRITIALYGNGSVVIYIEASDNPLGILEWANLMGFMNNLFSQRAGYSWDEMKSIFTVTVAEFSVDKEAKKKRSMNKCIEVKLFEGFLYRQYDRELDGKSVVRNELVTQPNIEVDEFERMFNVVVQGGVTEAYIDAKMAVIEHNVERMGQTVESFINRVDKEREVVSTRLKQVGADGSVTKALYDLSDRLSQSEANQQQIADALARVAEAMARAEGSPAPTRPGKRARKPRPERDLGAFGQGKPETQ